MSEAAISLPENSTNVRVPNRFRMPPAVRVGFRALSLLAPPLAAKLGVHLFSRPPRKKPGASWDQFAATAHPFRIATAEGELDAWSWGDGPTVVLHHGWGGGAAQMRGLVQPLLDAGFSVVAYDAYAHGTSDGTITNILYMAKHFAQVMHRVDAKYAIAYSLGTGGATIAARDGLPIDRMALISGPADMPFYLRQFADGLGFTQGVLDRMVTRIESQFGVDWEDMVVEKLVPAKGPKVMVVHDDSDDDIPMEHVTRVGAAWGVHDHIITKGLGHRGPLRDESVIRRVVEFLGGKPPIAAPAPLSSGAAEV